MNAIVEVPAGYRIDAKGRLIPVDQIKAIDIERSDLVERLGQPVRKQRLLERWLLHWLTLTTRLCHSMV